MTSQERQEYNNLPREAKEYYDMYMRNHPGTSHASAYKLAVFQTKTGIAVAGNNDIDLGSPKIQKGILEETAEFIKRAETGENMPLFTSCCPAWIQYAEKKHPELLPNISTCRSPMQMMASLLKEMHKDKNTQSYGYAPCPEKQLPRIHTFG